MTHPAKETSFIASLRKTNFKDSLDKLIRDVAVSVVHQHGIWLRSTHEVTKSAISNRVPLVVSPRGMLEPWAINNSKWKKKLAWLIYQERDLQKATAFHATAQSEAANIRRLGFKHPISVIPNGISPPKLDNGEWRMANVNLNHSRSAKRTALFLSRINPKKGLPMLLDAWAQIANDGWSLVIAGNDDSNHLAVVERKIQELGLSEVVELAGPLFGEAKENAYRKADLFLLPSYSENFGIVVAEALSYGIPVLTTTGCPWQELRSNNCGWWVDPTAESIEIGLREALSMSSNELHQMGIRGRQLVKEKYQWPSIAEQMLEFYNWIIHGGKQPKFVV